MEPTLSMQTAAVLFGVSALGGLVMAGLRFSGRAYPPASLAMLHGLLSGGALTLLIYAWFTVGLPLYAAVATVLFLIAAFGGVAMNLGYHWNHLPLPKWLVLTHAVVAVAAFVLLLAALWQHAPVAG